MTPLPNSNKSADLGRTSSPRAAKNPPDSPHGGGKDGIISNLFTLKKKSWGDGIAPMLLLLRTMASAAATKCFVSGGRRPESGQDLGSPRDRYLASHESSILVTRTKFRLRIVSVIILVR